MQRTALFMVAAAAAFLCLFGIFTFAQSAAPSPQRLQHRYQPPIIHGSVSTDVRQLADTSRSEV